MERIELHLRHAERGEPQLRFDFSRDAFDGQPQQSIVQFAYNHRATRVEPMRILR